MTLPTPQGMLRSRRAVAISAAVALLIAAFVSRSHAAQVKEVGRPVVGSRGVTRTMADIAAEQARHPGEPAPPALMLEHEIDRDHVGINPESQRVASVPAMPVDQLVYNPGAKGRPFHAFSPQSVGVNFTGATGTSAGGPFPPDTDGGVGPTQYIVFTNGSITSFNKTTGAADGVMNNISPNTFFTSVRNGSSVSDPQIRYDRLSNRWYLSIINVAAPNRWLLAVSDAASNGTITGATVWTYYQFTPATLTPSIGSDILSDYPSLGIDANALYMGVDEFTNSTQAFLQCDVFVIRKTSVLSGGPIVATAFRKVSDNSTAGPFAPRGVDNLDVGATEGYFIGADLLTEGLIDFIRVSNPGATPSISANIFVTVPLTGPAISVPHLGNTGGTLGNVDALDERPFQAYIRNQQLWTAQNFAVDNTGVVNATAANNTRDGSRWYQFNVPVGSGTPTIVQSGIVFTATGNNLTTERHYWVPSITVTGQGHAAMGFSIAGSNERINTATVGRLASDPLGTMETPLALTSSSTAYNPSGDNGSSGAGARRWGDYSITCVDPFDDMSIWTIQEFCSATNVHGERVTKLLAPGPASPSAMADVQAGQSSVSVTLTGTSASGTGFYDPGANLASPALPFNHLSAAITNGGATGTPPTVTSATYTDPTHVQLVLNTSAATANLTGEKYTITVTNPDGQTAAAAVVHVTAAGFPITASAGAGGTIAPSGTVNVATGGSQTFTITPDGCHTIGSVVVDGSSVGAVASYSFTNVQAAHTITASFTLIVETIAASAGANGSISPSGSVAVNCGGNQSFTITPAACYHIADVQVDGGSVGAVTSYAFTNVTTGHTIAASFALGVPAPGPVTSLAVAQVKSGNDGSGRTKITVTFTAPGGGATVEVWRKGFGSYPFYASPPGTGAAPTLPGSYPPSGWTLTSVTSTGQTDQPPTRDVWYYVAYGKDACGNSSTVSNLAGGVLDYHLGDVSDGVTPGQGNNTVNTADASLLGANYGATGASLVGVEYLDVGPTTDASTNGRPTPDGVVDFEDLVMFALNFTPHVSLVDKGGPTASIAVDAVGVSAPDAVSPGEVFDVPVTLSGAGDLMALSVTLGWNAAVVEPVGVTAGDLVTSQGGVTFSPGPGRADAALLGAAEGMAGEGAVAVVHFRALASGAPSIAVAHVAGRNASNHDVAVTLRNPLPSSSLVATTELYPVIPNPTRSASMVQYSLSKRGPVDVSVYSVDGRRIKTLAHGIQEVGRYQLNWDGTDTHGALIQSGVFFVRLEAAGTRMTRVLSVMR